MTIAAIILLGTGQGTTLSVLGDTDTVKAEAKDTGTAYGLWEFAVGDCLIV
jgi:hypothetical protein